MIRNRFVEWLIGWCPRAPLPKEKGHSFTARHVLAYVLLAITAVATITSSYVLLSLSSPKSAPNQTPLVLKRLTPEQKARAVEVALRDPQVQGMLEAADSHVIGVTEFCYERKTETGIIVAQREELAAVEILVSKNSNTTHLMTFVIVDLSKDVIELSGPVANIDQLVNAFPNYFERRRSVLQDCKFILVRRLNGADSGPLSNGC